MFSGNLLSSVTSLQKVSSEKEDVATLMHVTNTVSTQLVYSVSDGCRRKSFV